MSPGRLLFIIVLAAGCALVGLAVAGQPWRRLRPVDARTGWRGWGWGGAVGFAVGVILATHEIVGRWPVLREKDGWLPYAPTTGQDWIPWLVGLAGVVGVVESLKRPPTWARLLIRSVVSVGAVALVLHWKIPRTWDSPQEIALALGALGGGLFVLWNGLSLLAERSEGAPLPVALWGACAAAAGALAAGFESKFGVQLGALAACCGSAFVLSLWRPDVTLARGPITVFAVVYGTVILAAFYNVPNLKTVPVAGILLAVAPLGAWATQVWRVRRAGAVKRTLIGLTAAAAPAAAAAALVYLNRA